jgi:cysteine-rich repeat protein
LAAALLLAAGARGARAHDDPLPLSLWGDFGPAAARCQRALGSAATQCVLAAVDGRRTCIDAQLAGHACDRDAEAAAVLAARERALDKVAAQCSDIDATRLQFFGAAEALTDVVRVCRELETALVTAAYAPALRRGTAVPVADATRACLSATARGAAQVLRLAARMQRAPLDRIAAQPLSPAEKDDWIARARIRSTALHRTYAARIAAPCRDTEFADLYGRSVDAFVADISSRAECLAAGVYVQSAVLCPPARCGNAMQEPPEECDDGNAIDADWCSSNCRLNSHAPLRAQG